MREKIKLELSQAYKILAKLNLDDHTYTHLSARSEDGKSFYIYQFGLRFEEVEPENLLKISLNCEVLEGNEYQCNRTGYVMHSAIYRARDDINTIFHIHTPANATVSACEDGLLPITQWALHFFERISYHEYNSLLLEFDGTEELIKDLNKNYVVLLRNHGAITCGKTIQEAMFYTYHLEQACKAQCLGLAMGRKLVIPARGICEKAVKDLLTFEKDLGRRDWEAWLRIL